MTPFSRPTAALLLAALSLVLGACGSGGAVQRNVLITGAGVTGQKITLGVLTERSGPFASFAAGLARGQQAYWQAQNAQGGVCGRQVSLIVAGSERPDPQGAEVTGFLPPRVLALEGLASASAAPALLPRLERDSIYAGLPGGPPTLLRSRVVAIPGTTYDLEAISGIDWLVRHKGLKPGDTIGDLHSADGYGEGALAGVRYAARKHGLKVVERTIAPGDADVATPLAAMGKANVRALWVSTGPGQLVSLARAAKAAGLDVPIGVDGAAFSPQAGGDVTTFTSTAPISSSAPAVKRAAVAYRRSFPNGTPASSVVAGWAQAEIMDQVLQKACDDNALTRRGVVRALHELNLVDTGGLVAGPLDFSQTGQPSTKAIYVLTADRTAPGGQQLFEGPFVSPDAMDYVDKAP